MADFPYKKLLRISGGILMIASLIFLVIAAHQRWTELSELHLAPLKWLELAGLIILYGCSLLLLAASWHWLLTLTGRLPVRQAHSMYAFAQTQLAKYVPGNVFHIVGRHMIMRNQGVADRQLVFAVAMEVPLMMVGALAAIAIALLLDWMLAGYDLPLNPLLASALILVVTASVCIRGAAGKREANKTILAGSVLLLNTAFFAIMGFVVTRLVHLLIDVESLVIAAGGVAAWLVGYVTPGAPGGIGVREAAMMLLIGDRVSPTPLLLSAALFRLVTLLGDVVFFVLGNLLLRDR